MTSRYRRVRVIALATSALIAVSVLVAPLPGQTQNADQQPLPIEAIVDILREQGFQKFRRFERKGDDIEVEARDIANRKVLLILDPVTGDIRQSRPR